MGIKLTRRKPRIILLSVIYRLQKLLPLSKANRFKLFLNLEWIFERLSHEISFKYYAPSDHPIRNFSKEFILENIKETDTVLDLGSNYGYISYFIAEKAKEVIGIDYTKEFIEAAKQRYKRDNLKFYNIEALEYLKKNEKHFDILILSHILEHLDNPKDFIMNFKDYFKKIYIELPDFDKSYLNHFRKDLKLDLIYTDDDHVSEFDRKELYAILSECNIEVTKAEYRFGVQKLWCKVNTK